MGSHRRRPPSHRAVRLHPRLRRARAQRRVALRPPGLTPSRERARPSWPRPIPLHTARVAVTRCCRSSSSLWSSCCSVGPPGSGGGADRPRNDPLAPEPAGASAGLVGVGRLSGRLCHADHQPEPVPPPPTRSGRVFRRGQLPGQRPLVEVLGVVPSAWCGRDRHPGRHRDLLRPARQPGARAVHHAPHPASVLGGGSQHWRRGHPGVDCHRRGPGIADRRDSRLLRRSQLSRQSVPTASLLAGGSLRGRCGGHRCALVHTRTRGDDRVGAPGPAHAGHPDERPPGPARHRSTRPGGRAGPFSGVGDLDGCAATAVEAMQEALRGRWRPAPLWSGSCWRPSASTESPMPGRSSGSACRSWLLRRCCAPSGLPLEVDACRGRAIDRIDGGRWSGSSSVRDWWLSARWFSLTRSGCPAWSCRSCPSPCRLSRCSLSPASWLPLFPHSSCHRGAPSRHRHGENSKRWWPRDSLRTGLVHL